MAPSCPDAFFDWIRFEPDVSPAGAEAGTAGRRRVQRQRAREPALGGRAPEPGPDGQRRRAAHPGRAGRHLRSRRQRQQPRAARRARRSLGGGRRSCPSRARPSTTRPACSSTATTTTSRSSAASPIRRRVTRSSSSSTRTRAFRATTRPTPPPTCGAAFPLEFFLRIRRTAPTSPARTPPTAPTGRPSAGPRRCPPDARIGVFAFNNWRRPAHRRRRSTSSGLTTGSGGGGGGPTGPSRDDQFDGSTLDTTRWNAIVRDNPSAYSVGGGELTITTEPGDIFTGDTVPPPNNFILQSADHAGADWTLETKLSGTINGGYGQGGLIAHVDGGNYVKLDAISDAGNRASTASSCAPRSAMRSRSRSRTWTCPRARPTSGCGWPRRHTYSGEYSFDGGPGRAIAPTRLEPDGLARLRPVRVRPAGGRAGDTVSFDYFTLDGQLGCEEPPPENTPPAIGSVTASPTSGFGPLQVAFNVSGDRRRRRRPHLQLGLRRRRHEDRP